MKSIADNETKVNEKEYSFSKVTLGLSPKNNDSYVSITILKESELEDKHKQILFGELLAKFKGMPESVQESFENYCIDKLRKKLIKEFSTKICLPKDSKSIRRQVSDLQDEKESDRI